MKKVLGLCLAVSLFTLGIQGRAEAVPSLTLRICQGNTCVSIGPSPVFVMASPIVVGDYLVYIRLVARIIAFGELADDVDSGAAPGVGQRRSVGDLAVGNQLPSADGS